MNNKIYYVNVYSLPDSIIVNKIKQLQKHLFRYNFSFFNINEPPPPQKIIGSLIIIDESSSNDVYNIFQDIIKSYKYEPVFVISSNNPDYKNAVKWMKIGAKDYFDSGTDYSDNDIDKILYDALYYHGHNFFEEKTSDDPFNYPPIQIETSNKWHLLDDNHYYDMSVLAVSIILEKEAVSKYSKESLDKLLKKIEDFITKLSNSINGKKLYWNYDKGIFIFHFGDRINNSVLASISILNESKLFTLESLSLLNLFDIKLSIHDGKILYIKEESNFITSDAINSSVHLQNFNNDIATIDITENVYNYLNPRIKRFFFRAGLFEGRGIYTYYYKY